MTRTPTPVPPAKPDRPVVSDSDLVERAVRGAERLTGRFPRWSHVGRIFSIGSGSATALCRRFDLDPDEVVGT